MTYTNVQHNSDSRQGAVLFLDTLAQLPPNKYGNDETLRKRARSKHYTQSIVIPLLHLKSPLHKYYQSAFYCNTELQQSGVTLKGKYCNTRCCNVCNRIRTAKLMKGYLNQMKGQQYFVTLTFPNVKQAYLKDSINQMIKNATLIIRNLREKKKIDVNGIRKLECTYNEKANTYHPHFHLIVDTKEGANKILEQWLKRYPTASIKAQDIRKVNGDNDDSLKELFKYSTKIGYKAKGEEENEEEGRGEIRINIKALDKILIAMRGKRVFQPFGNIKKESEEVNGEELDAQSYNIPQAFSMNWIWLKHDWVNKYYQNLACVDAPKYKIVNTSEYEFRKPKQYRTPPDGPLFEYRKQQRELNKESSKFEFQYT